MLKRIVITWVTTQEGGAEESVRILSSTICKLYNLDVYLIVWNLNSSTDECLPNLNSKVKYSLCKTYSKYVECLQEALTGSPHEVFLFGNHRSFSIDVFEAKCKKIKCAVVFRGIVIPDKPIRIISNEKLEEFITNKIDWKYLNEADAFIGISNCSSDSLKQIVSPEKVYRIYNGVDDGWFMDDSLSIHISKFPKKFLICTRLVPWKDISTGLKGFFMLANKYPEISLDIIGEGVEMDALLKLVDYFNMKDKVHFRGYQSDPQKWYRKCDCLIHPSPIEGFGRVIAEANANGLIAIVPQSGAAGELVIDSHTGFTFQKNDANSCYHSLQLFVESSFEQRLNMAKKAIVRAKTLFSATHMAAEYVNFANYCLREK